MKKADTAEFTLSTLHRLTKSLYGLYSRVGKRFNVDRSFVSRVVRGERRSDEIERALISEFKRIATECGFRA
jgi:hypothetical protein